jgi:anti-anti-sigma factor
LRDQARGGSVAFVPGPSRGGSRAGSERRDTGQRDGAEKTSVHNESVCGGRDVRGARSHLGLAGNASQRVGAMFGLHRVSSSSKHTLTLAGELDLAAAPQLGNVVARLPMDHTTSLALDLHEVTFIDCAGIRAILAIQDLCAQRRCGFSLVPGRAQVQRLFELCGLVDQLSLRPDDGRVGADA